MTHGDHHAVWRAANVAFGLIGIAATRADVEAAHAVGAVLSVGAVVLAVTAAAPANAQTVVQ